MKPIIVPYPFVKCRATVPKDGVLQEIDSWRPGVIFIQECPEEDGYAYADAMGEMVLQVVGKFKPKGYPERVFFTRQWKRPDGILFGKKRLMIDTAAQFNRRCAGYRYPYEIDGVEQDGA